MAEVLITLGIIGVVVAITMPTLIANYQKKVLVSQFKKSYSILQNAINLVNAENGIPYECYFDGGNLNDHLSECNQFYEKFFDKLHVVNFCSARDTNCRVQYKNITKVLEEGGKASNSACSYHVGGSNGYNLSDGSILYVLETVDTKFNNQNALFIGFDINGLKGPNRWGYDLFYLNLNRKNMSSSVTLSTKVCELIEKDGLSAEEIMSE